MLSHYNIIFSNVAVKQYFSTILKVCLHDGTCNVDENYSDGYNCDCMDEFTGRHCEYHALCENGGGCQNGATCRVDKDTSELRCDCMLGYIGDRCETGIIYNDPSELLPHIISNR